MFTAPAPLLWDLHRCLAHPQKQIMLERTDLKQTLLLAYTFLLRKKMNKIHSLLMYITYNISTFVDIPHFTHSFIYSMGLTYQPGNYQRLFMPRKKINTPGWTNIIRLCVKKRAGCGNHQERCLWPPRAQHRTSQCFTCLLKHAWRSPRSSPPRRSFQPRAACTSGFSSPVVKRLRQQLQDRHQREFRRTPEPAGLL